MQKQTPLQQLPLKRLTEGVPLAPLPQPGDQPAELLGQPQQAEGDPDPAQDVSAGAPVLGESVGICSHGCCADHLFSCP